MLGTGNEPLRTATTTPAGVVAARLIADTIQALAGAGSLDSFFRAAGTSDRGREARLGACHLLAYSCGVFSARRLAALIETDVAYQELVSGLRPSFGELIAYRDRSNEALALLFTDVILAFADGGLERFMELSLTSVSSTKERTSRARQAAEIAVALLNDAKRSDDADAASLGERLRGDELPADLESPTGRAARIAAMLNTRTAVGAHSEWDEPTTLIDLGALEHENGAGRLPARFRESLVSAVGQAGASGLLPRAGSSQPPPAGYAPARSPATGAAPQQRVDGSNGRSGPPLIAPALPEQIVAPGRLSSTSGTAPVSSPPTRSLVGRATGQHVTVAGPPSGSRQTGASTTVRTEERPASRSQSAGSVERTHRTVDAPAVRPDASAGRSPTVMLVATDWFAEHWRTIVWFLVGAVVTAMLVAVWRF